MMRFWLPLVFLAGCATQPKGTNELSINPNCESGLPQPNRIEIAQATVCAMAGSTDHLEGIARLALKSPDSRWWGYFYLSHIYESQNPTYALWLIEKAELEDSQDAMVRYQKARILWQLKETQESLQIFEKLASEGHSGARQFLAEFLYAQGHCSRAKEFGADDGRCPTLAVSQ